MPGHDPKNAGVKHDGLHLSFLLQMILSCTRACMCNTFATVRLFSPFVSIQIGESPQGSLPLYHKTGRGAISQTTSRASARGCNLNFSNSVPGAVSLPQCSLRILSLQYWPWLRVLVSPRAPHLSGALEARGRGATLGRYPGERKQEGARESPLSFLPSEGSFALLLLFAQQRSTLLDRFLCHVNVFCLVRLRHAFDL